MRLEPFAECHFHEVKILMVGRGNFISSYLWPFLNNVQEMIDQCRGEGRIVDVGVHLHHLDIVAQTLAQGREEGGVGFGVVEDRTRDRQGRGRLALLTPRGSMRRLGLFNAPDHG